MQSASIADPGTSDTVPVDSDFVKRMSEGLAFCATAAAGAIETASIASAEAPTLLSSDKVPLPVLCMLKAPLA